MPNKTIIFDFHETLATPERQFQCPQNDACLVERPHLFENIMAHFSKPKSEILLVTGLRGIGKSYLATEYWTNTNKYYTIRAWFHLKPTSASLEVQYLKFAVEIGLTFPAETAVQDKILSIKNWLEKQSNILLIYDDVPDAQSIKGFLPENGEQHEILITTCNPLGWEPCQAFQFFPVPVMNEYEAFQLINKITGYADQPAIKQLIKLMDGLPLALAQASYYMNLKAVNAPGYLNRYLQSQSYLLDYKPTEKVSSNYSKYHESEFNTHLRYEKVNFDHKPLWQTFDSELEILKKNCNEAWLLLLKISWLASNPIPETIVQRLLNSHEEPHALWADVKAAILRFRFVQQMEDGSMSMHTLLQDLLRSKQDLELSQLHLAKITPIIEEETAVNTALIAHKERLKQHAGNFKIAPTASTPFVFKFSPPEEKKLSPATSSQISKPSNNFFNLPTFKSKKEQIRESLAKFNLSEEEQAIYEKILSGNVNYKISDKEGFLLEGTSSFEYKDKDLFALGLKPGQWQTKTLKFTDHYVYIRSWSQCLENNLQKPADLVKETDSPSDKILSLQKTARAALAAKDYTQAILQYGNLISQYDAQPKKHSKENRAIAYFSLGLSHLRLEDWKSAYPYLKKAVKFHPNCKLYQLRLRECEALKNSNENPLLGNFDSNFR